MRYGIKESIWKEIISILDKSYIIDSAVLYGSRAKGCFKPGSDIDLALKGVKLSLMDIQKILLDIEDLYLPYEIDLCIYENITNLEFKEHIDRVGIVIYEREKNSAV